MSDTVEIPIDCESIETLPPEYVHVIHKIEKQGYIFWCWREFDYVQKEAYFKKAGANTIRIPLVWVDQIKGLPFIRNVNEQEVNHVN